ncbi:fluoride efflux transporter FluC [Zafaria sp. J156]|uniref:fluoride efflux transporter FluC n=1 Tax=Zafaria sp. J156 TaxID=3116490 RepID=UPI002E75C87B|nr:CrcB family protein [Zafaria sp. J156]MEE1620907.1 CrcB family protein [Zafaria sp. J156]
MTHEPPPRTPHPGTAGTPRESGLVLAALVFAGGTIGTGLRIGVAHLVPDAAGLPLGILVINVSGAFALGLLLAALAARGPDEGRRKRARLCAGTGLLGGYTTYSALATDTTLLLDAGQAATAVLYGLGSAAAGVAAAVLGAATAHALSRGGRA